MTRSSVHSLRISATASASRSERSLNFGHSIPIDGFSFIASPVPIPRITRPGFRHAERRERVRDHRRLVAQRRRQHARRQRHPLRALTRARPDRSSELGAWPAVMAPRLEVVGNRDDVEAVLLSADSEIDQLTRRKLLCRSLVSVTDGAVIARGHTDIISSAGFPVG